MRAGDIVLVRTNPDVGGDLPYFTDAALEFLIAAPIKLLASAGNMYYGPPPNGHTAAEKRLFECGIPMVDALKGLDQVRRERVFFIGLPLKMQRVTASWCRAIALEEI